MLMHPVPTQTPHLITQLPGPKAKQMIATDEQYTSPSYTRGYPLAVARGEGAPARLVGCFEDDGAIVRNLTRRLVRNLRE